MSVKWRHPNVAVWSGGNLLLVTGDPEREDFDRAFA